MNKSKHRIPPERIPDNANGGRDSVDGHPARLKRIGRPNQNRPTTAEPHWAKGVGENADMGWQLFIVEVNERTGKLVVRFANALHTEFAKSPKSIEPWFTPSPDRWEKWTVAKPPDNSSWQNK